MLSIIFRVYIFSIGSKEPNKIEDFIKYQQAMFIRWENEKKTAPNEQILELKFDELITE